MVALRPADRVFCVVLLFLLVSSAGDANDWPMWRFDAQRSAASPNHVGNDLNLLWQKDFRGRSQAWDDPLNLDLMTYDRVFEPIVMEGRLFVSFNDSDKVVAFDTETGKEIWRFYTEGPVRLPPVGSDGHVFFTSDDGFLYCVDAANGKLNWKFSGAPSSQHAIGNRRLSAAWPARGGAVVRDDTVYFAASIWPFMGTFIYALDAETGEVRWVNDRTGSQYIKQPHSAPSFAGVAPQGAFVATDSLLVVPGGRSVPAVFDRNTGDLRYFELNAGGKGTGGSFVAADEKNFYVHTRLKGTRAFNLADGVKTAFMPNEPVLHQGMVYSAEIDDNKYLVRAYDQDGKMAWEMVADGTGDLILAGDQLIAAGTDRITMIQLPIKGQPAKVTGSILTDRPTERVIAADGKLFAVSLDGHLTAYGPTKPKETPATEPHDIIVAPDESQQIARDLLSVGDASGYAFWFGDCSDLTVQAMALQSPFLQFAIVDSETSEIERVRRMLDASRLYGTVTVHHSNPVDFKPPHYVANMVFVDAADSRSPKDIEAIYRAVRPYGGVMHLLDSTDPQTLHDRITAMNLDQAVVAIDKHGVTVRREGALPGAADWTHQYGDIANTIKSNDSRVKLPLGVLWFGGSSNLDVLPRHGHGPPEQVVGGRLFIQGMNSLSARDVYTGRVLWKREFKDLGTFDVYYDKTFEDTPLDPKYNQVHIPGANARGTNYVVTDDRVYIVEGGVCHALDPATGQTLAEFQLPKSDSGEPEQWGYLGVYRDVLIGGLGFAMYRGRNSLTFEADKKLKATKAGFGSKSYDRAASVALVGFDRHSGKQLWKVDANHSFWHNGIVAGGGKVYCLDRTPKTIEDALMRRGKSRAESYRIVAFDYQTGRQTWETSDNIFGTWLGYSEPFDLLLQAGAKASDRLSDEVAEGMAVYRGADGTVQWRKDSLQYSGPCILHNDLIITNANSYSESAGAFFLKTGEPKLVENPLTGQSQPWKITRAYGCNSIIASENLLTFRSGAAGFYDLLTDSGTGNLGGFKSGCTANLVVANGVLNAPDYTRTCSCAYQNQTSLALVHMPEIETWSIHNGASSTPHGEAIQNLAINFGAPGDRRDEQGNLWLEYPVVAGDSPPIAILTNPETTYFRRHSSTITSTDRPWISASGAKGITDLRIELHLKDEYDLNNGIPVRHANDDAEENEDGDVNLISSDLELVEDSGVQKVGLRFNGINIAAQTKIRGAYIQFTCDEAADQKAALIIAAEDVGNALAYSDQSHDLSSRTLTAKEVGWNPAAWKKAGESGAQQRTPDLSSLVQAVIDRDDWQPGNSLAFQISGAGKRIAASSKGGLPKAAKLVIDADTTARIVDRPAQNYDVTLFFSDSGSSNDGGRIFDVYAQGECLAEDVAVRGSDGTPEKSLLLENVSIVNELHLRFIPKHGTPVLSGIQIQSR